VAAADGARIVARSLRLLRTLTTDAPALSAVELSRRTGLSISSVYRFLTTFRAHRLIEVDGTGRFQPGLGLLELAAPLLNGLDIRRASLPALQGLQATTGATAFLTVLRGNRAICVEKVESDATVRVCPEVGRSRPLHAGAPAKVLFAFMDTAQRDAVLGGALERVTRKTLVDRRALARQLDRIRGRGYAISQSEFLPATRAVAVPVRDRGGAVVASLAIAATTAQLTPEGARRFVPVLVARAREVSATLGYRESQEPERTPRAAADSLARADTSARGRNHPGTGSRRPREARRRS
jgi:DNA-binding IclR family transcriptional regulator